VGALAVVLLGLLGLLAAGWLAIRGKQARTAVDAARVAGERTRTALLAGDTAAAQRELGTAGREARRARTLVSDPVWRTATRLPAVGDDVRAVRTVVTAVDDVTSGVLPPVVTVGSTLRPAALRVRGDAIALAPLLRAQAPLAGAAARAEAVRARVTTLDRDGLVGPVERGVADAQGALDELAETTAGASRAAALLPPMLGATGPRRYFLAFQNSAEARGTGGLLGAYGILEADRGRLRLRHLGPNTELRPVRRMPIDLGADFAALYNDDPALWANANVSPHFPYAARIWLALWSQQRGQRLDGVIATDPTALSYVLRATGPVSLPDGQRIGAANAVPATLRDVYARFPAPGDNPRRDAYLQQIAAAVVAKLLSGSGDPRAVADALGRAAGERRLLVYSTREDEQARLEAAEVSGSIPRRGGPYAAFVVNNAAGGKLDYYLDRRLRYRSEGCAGPQRRSRITATLTSRAPARGLPRYVVLRADKGGGTSAPGEPTGTNVSLVQVYAAKGATLVTAKLDGQPILVTAGAEQGHAVFQARVVLRPGQRRELDLELREPAALRPGEVGTFDQPLVRPLVKDLPPAADVVWCSR
jgi:hypothetical protein